MNVDAIIERCESRANTEDRKLILALAREVKRGQSAGGKSSKTTSGSAKSGGSKDSENGDG